MNTDGGETVASMRSVPDTVRSQLMMSMSSMGGESLQEVWKMLEEARPSPTPRLSSPKRKSLQGRSIHYILWPLSFLNWWEKETTSKLEKKFHFHTQTAFDGYIMIQILNFNLLVSAISLTKLVGHVATSTNNESVVFYAMEECFYLHLNICDLKIWRNYFSREFEFLLRWKLTMSVSFRVNYSKTLQ